ncbi:MAG: D-2-hydroxyacid dehydrogenase [Armatimonadaceae bacterium]
MSLILLVPQTVVEDLHQPVQEIVPNARLLAYAENTEVLPGAAEAQIVLRWIAGKRYERFVREGESVRWLHTASAGVDHVVTPALRETFGERPQLVLTDSGPAFGICMGEFVLAWMLAVAHRIPTLLEQERQKVWKWVTQEELHGQTVGIIGLGPIGRGVAERCKAFGMRTLGLRRRPEPVPGVDAVYTGAEGLTTLLRESDWLVVAAASTPGTRHLIGTAELAQMKPSARIINVARGALIDEAALITALQNGQISGACLDVFAEEPLPQDSPLWEMPNAFVTPHTSPGWTEGLRRRQLDLFLANLRRFIADEPLEGVVDVEQGY